MKIQILWMPNSIVIIVKMTHNNKNTRKMNMWFARLGNIPVVDRKVLREIALRVLLGHISDKEDHNRTILRYNNPYEKTDEDPFEYSQLDKMGRLMMMRPCLMIFYNLIYQEYWKTKLKRHAITVNTCYIYHKTGHTSHLVPCCDITKKNMNNHIAQLFKLIQSNVVESRMLLRVKDLTQSQYSTHEKKIHHNIL